MIKMPAMDQAPIATILDITVVKVWGASKSPMGITTRKRRRIIRRVTSPELWERVTSTISRLESIPLLLTKLTPIKLGTTELLLRHMAIISSPKSTRMVIPRVRRRHMNISLILERAKPIIRGLRKRMVITSSPESITVSLMRLTAIKFTQKSTRMAITRTQWRHITIMHSPERIVVPLVKASNTLKSARLGTTTDRRRGRMSIVSLRSTTLTQRSTLAWITITSTLESSRTATIRHRWRPMDTIICRANTTKDQWSATHSIFSPGSTIVVIRRRTATMFILESIRQAIRRPRWKLTVIRQSLKSTKLAITKGY